MRSYRFGSLLVVTFLFENLRQGVVCIALAGIIRKQFDGAPEMHHRIVDIVFGAKQLPGSQVQSESVFGRQHLHHVILRQRSGNIEFGL